jgi:hypothetical protein
MDIRKIVVNYITYAVRMKTYKMMGLCIAVLLLSSFVSAVSENEFKEVLKDSLFEFFENPQNASLKVEEAKDLVEYYLQTPRAEIVVDMNKRGRHSGYSIQKLFSNSLIRYRRKLHLRNRTIQCSAGWKCQSRFHANYQSYDCSWKPEARFCEYGCLKGKCMDSPEINHTNQICTAVYKPVCADNGRTYSNDCFAKLANTQIVCKSECPCLNDTSACRDSDGGKNFDVKGIATAYGQSLSDHCNNDGTLTEKYCENERIKWYSYRCPQGCRDGACRKNDSLKPSVSGYVMHEGETRIFTLQNKSYNITLGFIGGEPSVARFSIDGTLTAPIKEEDSSYVSENGLKFTKVKIVDYSETEFKLDYVSFVLSKQGFEPEISICYYKNNPYSYGSRIAISGISYYCDLSGNFTRRVSWGGSCENDFECMSNICRNGICYGHAYPGACIVRNDDSHMPHGYETDITKNYSRKNINGVYTYDEIRNRCTISEFESLMDIYCKQNNKPVIWQYAIYTDEGIYNHLSTNQVGGWHYCDNITSNETHYNAYCSESDGGKNFYSKATTMGRRSDGTTYHQTDVCGYNIHTDHLLHERYCYLDGTGWMTYDYDCAKEGKVCIDGACVAQSNCTDTDGGKSYYTKGSVITRDEKYTDFCSIDGPATVYRSTDPRDLVEYYCYGDVPNSIMKKCEYSCKDGVCTNESNSCQENGGRCISSNTGQCYSNEIYIDGYECPNNGGCCLLKSLKCTDSDGGKNYDVKGTVTSEGLSKTDYCGSRWSVVEMFCLNLTIASYAYRCDFECQNGACVKGSNMSLHTNNYYVRDGTGLFSSCGQDWGNACDDLPSNLIRGATYYIADGSYSSYTFDDAESGSEYIYIKKATLWDHGIDRVGSPTMEMVWQYFQVYLLIMIIIFLMAKSEEVPVAMIQDTVLK